MSTKWLKSFLWSYLIIMTLVGIHIYGLTIKANGDNVEHLHSAWLVWQGYTPYKDFFQHHNPLTWYLTAPIVAGLINHISIFYIFNIIGVLVLGLIAYYLCKIVLLDKISSIGALLLAAFVVSSYSLLWSTDFRPDTFMYLTLLIGLYYLFLYRTQPRLQFLVISFFCFFLSFMFTQKVLMNLIVPCFVVIYWLLTKKINIKDVLYASILPILLLLLFISYLYYKDALMIYWKANYLFNSYIPDIFQNHRVIFPPLEYFDFYIFIPLGGIACCYFLYKGNEKERILSLMFVVETLIRLFYFSAFLHYVMFWLILGILLTVMMFDKLLKFKKTAVICSIAYLMAMLIYNYTKTYAEAMENHGMKTGYELSFEALTPCDYAINGYYAVYNLKAKDPGYYAILLGQIDVLGEKTGIAKRDNLNDLIRQKMPKIISGGIYWDTYWEERGKRIPAHQIDQFLIQSYYDYSGVGDLLILKPQYQKHMCVYNGTSWEFID